MVADVSREEFVRALSELARQGAVRELLVFHAQAQQEEDRQAIAGVLATAIMTVAGGGWAVKIARLLDKRNFTNGGRSRREKQVDGAVAAFLRQRNDVSMPTGRMPSGPATVATRGRQPTRTARG